MKPPVHQRVCALLGPGDERVRRALAAGPGPPGSTVEDARLRSGLERALATGADWIWVLDGSAIPKPDALAALLAGLERSEGLPEPSLLTGVVVDSHGRVARERSPWYRRYTMDVALEGAERGLLPVRGTPGPALVRREAVEAHAADVDTRLVPEDVLCWTVMLLRERTGYLVPESESEIVPGAGDPLRRPTTALRLMRSSAMARWDRLGVALEFAERAGRRASPGPGA